jgi:hypothetical protein
MAAWPSAPQRRGRVVRSHAPLAARGCRGVLRETVNLHLNHAFDPSHLRPLFRPRRRRLERASAGRRLAPEVPGDGKFSQQTAKIQVLGGLHSMFRPIGAHLVFYVRRGKFRGGFVDFGPLGLFGPGEGPIRRPERGGSECEPIKILL